MKKLVYMKFGSHLYGTNTPSSDLDFKGVFLADLRDVVLNRASESIVEKTNKNNNKRNTKDDTDVEYKELRTFLREAMAGQTYALDMLFATDDMILETSDIWKEVVKNRHKLLSKNLKPFIGYCRAQAVKYGLKGSRLEFVEQMLGVLKPLVAEHAGKTLEELSGKFVLPESKYCQVLDEVHPNGGKVKYLQLLEKKFDYKVKVKDVVSALQEIYDKAGARAHAAKNAGGVDYKALSHAYRCIYELEELVTTGHITFPLKQLDRVMEIKLGKVSYEEMNEELPVLIERVLSIESSVLPDEPDRKFWDNFILDVYGINFKPLKPSLIDPELFKELPPDV